MVGVEPTTAAGNGSAICGVVATSWVRALAIPIEATRPSVVEAPMPAAAIRDRFAAWRRGRRRGNGVPVRDDPDGLDGLDGLDGIGGLGRGGGRGWLGRSGSKSVIVISAFVLVVLVVVVV